MKHIDKETISKVHAEFNSLRNIGAVVKSFAGVIPSKTVKDLLRSRRHEQIIVRSRQQKFDDASIINAVTAAETAGVTTAAGYREWRTASGEDMPSLALIIRRFGSWNAAREEAGYTTKKRFSRGDLKQWSDESMRSSFAEFIFCAYSNYETPTPAAYDSWSRERADVPLLSTIRARLSTQRKSWADFVRECEPIPCV
jgi:hypothetical protein